MNPIKRRTFLKAGLGSTVIGFPSLGKALGANDRVQVALVGCGGRGTQVTSSLASRSDVVCTQICDIHEKRLVRTADFIAKQQGGRKPLLATHMEEVFANKDVDAVVVATPDHWHTPAAILACQAGKDVYVEKPFSHNIWEGRKLVEAARKYKRVVQVGTQNRSAPYNLAARDYIQSGKLGDIRLVKVFNLKGGGPFHLGAPGQAPSGFPWKTWLGPAKTRPYHSKIFHGGWHYFWDYSGGDLADCGIHQLDLTIMALGDPATPKSVSASGGRLQHKGDDSEVPDVEILHYDYPEFVMTFEHSHFANAMSKINGRIRSGDQFPYWPQCATRIEFYGTKDNMMLGRHGGGWQVFTSGGKVVEEQYGRHPDLEHQQNFVDCIRNRKRPNADVGLAHGSTTVMHMGNIAHRVGNQKLQFDAGAERFIGNDAANLLSKRHNVNPYSVKEMV
jgi:predicted dehydrogenase